MPDASQSPAGQPRQALRQGAELLGMLGRWPALRLERTQKNFVLGVTHEGLWGAGMSLFLPATVLSLALVDLGRSASAVGLLASLSTAGISLPQVFSAFLFPPRFTDPKYLAWLHVPALLGPLTTCLAFFFSPPTWQTGRLLLLFAGAILFGLGIGISSPHWLACIGRCIPEDRRGRYFGASFCANGLGATFTGWLGSRLISDGGTAWGYTACFAIAVPLLTASLLVLSRLTPILARPDARPSACVRNGIEFLSDLLRRSTLFRVGVLLVILMTFAAAPGSLFTVYLREAARVDTMWFQIFSPALMAGGLAGAFLLGWLVDHKGVRTAYALALGMGLAALGLVSLWDNRLLVTLAFACSGFGNAAFVVVNFVFLLRLGGQKESSVQAGLFNTLISPWSVGAPLLTGWLAASAGYPIAFGVAVASCLGASCLLAANRKLDERQV